MRRATATAAFLVLCVGLLASGCDSAVSSDQLNGNAFTNMESKLERVGAGSGEPLSALDGALRPTYPASGVRSLTLYPTQVRAANLDDDEFDDLLVRYQYGSCPGCEASAVTISPPDGGKDHSLEPSTSLYDLPLDVADLNGDGRDELVFIDREAGEIAVYDDSSGEERERFGPMPCLTTATGVIDPPASVPRYQLVDINGDGRADLLCVGRQKDWQASNEPVLTIHLARTEELGFAGATEQRWTGQLLSFGDFDGDGKLDYLLQETTSTHPTSEAETVEADKLKLAVAYGDGTGSFGEPMRVYENPELSAGTLLAVADFDGDGASDLIWLDDPTSCVTPLSEGPTCFDEAQYLQADPAILFGSKKRGETFVRKPFEMNLMVGQSAGPQTSHAADLNGDGAAELIQTGRDRQFGAEMGYFLRVMQVVDGAPTLVSSTRLGPLGPRLDRDLPPPIIEYEVVDGHFVAGDGTQLLLVAYNTTSDATLYRWVTSD